MARCAFPDSFIVAFRLSYLPLSLQDSPLYWRGKTKSLSPLPNLLLILLYPALRVLADWHRGCCLIRRSCGKRLPNILDTSNMNCRECTGVYAIDESISTRLSQTDEKNDSETTDVNRCDQR
jgi:hypothetical protein